MAATKEPASVFTVAVVAGMFGMAVSGKATVGLWAFLIVFLGMAFLAELT